MKNKKYQAKNLSNIQRQQGWTMWSLSFVLGSIILFAYIGIQLFPVYAANNNVKNAMRLAVENIDKNKISRAGIVKSIDNQLYIDGSGSLLDYKNDLEVKRSKRELIITVNYERRIPLFFNLSLVASFNNQEILDL